MRKSLHYLFALLFVSTFSHAQYYKFSKSTSAYSEINGTKLSSGDFTEDDIFPMKLPFTFNLFGKNFDSLYVTTGYASFDYSTAEVDGQLYTDMSGYEMYVFDSFDKVGIDSATVSYTTTGTVGNRIVKIQWKGITFDSDDSQKDYVNGQLWLYEKGYTVEYHYGPTSILDSSTLEGTNGGFLISILNKDGSDGYVLSGDATNPKTNTPVQNPSGTVAPPHLTGMVYTFSTSGYTPVLPPALSEKVLVFPNPFVDKINIQNLSGTGIQGIKIYDMDGKLVSSNQGSVQEISTANLSTGVYQIVISTEQGEFSRKLVK